ncbi:MULTISPECIES: Xaa-Pro peptidase family protein [unclassified Corynebacterium]|uniref:M24 family metallopeptidase n=1 Tax=unclassified Corynebacterium TaxID=2624378 RepID=UPI0029CA47FC|nr:MULTISPECIES: Xaa-Pro peptidase family protein [unclassified Corynebacterium]WPF67183.1 Xaa-Pro peptidase family protein [Corynebacterium sp. 22KM0430]WPF69672.1 Xaa-Pro peptidase family protein [Corynebacterium sp. 21KM1197]
MTDMSTERFDSTVYAARLRRAAEICAQQDLAGVIIGTGAEMAYFLGSWASTHERFSALVIPAQGAPALIAPKADIADFHPDLLTELGITARGWADGENPYALVSLPQEGTIGLGESLTTAHILAVQERFPSSPMILAASALRGLVMSKDAAEVEQLRAAAQAIDAVHARVPDLLRPGRTEAEVAADLRELILREHTTVDFIIVGSGPHGANPHHSYSDRVLRAGEMVVIDIGGTYGVGYHSDCTRTYIVGGPGEEPEMYRVLRQAQEAACRAVRPGVTAAQIDAAAREVIEAAGYGEQFFHRTGHGIGLSIHEEPFIMAGNDLVIEEGMAFSVEPGIYLDGECGARIEDIVVVTSEGCERLNTQPRTLR